jgi:transcriptional regulator CtsR
MQHREIKMTTVNRTFATVPGDIANLVACILARSNGAEGVCERVGGAEGLIPLLLAKWEARTWMRAKLEEAARAQLNGKMPTDDIEALIEQQIATEQATYLVEFFWLLTGAGCAAPDRMEAWIDRHNAVTARMWAEVLLDKTTRTAKLLMADARRLQQQQGDLLAELLGCLEKARRRILMGIGYDEAPAAECLQSLDTADNLLRELVLSKRGDASPRPQHRALLAELEAPRQWPCAPPGPRRRRRLERLLDQAHFGFQAKHACSARLDGTHVILSNSDVERFMMLHMDPKLCRERLNALSKAGLLQEDRLTDDRCSTVRLFRPTVRLEAAVAGGLKPVRATASNHPRTRSVGEPGETASSVQQVGMRRTLSDH